MTSTHRLRGFTLIELLTVIAIIGILAGILIPTVGAVRTSAKRTASVIFLGQLEVALFNYKAEYGYFPGQIGTSTATSNSPVDSSVSINLTKKEDSSQFIRVLTARNPDGSRITDAEQLRQLNPKALSFFSFADSNFYVDEDTGQTDSGRIADRFNNTAITVTMDTDGNGYITPPDSDKSFRREVGIRVAEDKDKDKGMPGYGTY